MVVQKAKEEETVKKTVRFGEQAAVPAIGLGTWYMGENSAQRPQEVAALRAGIDHGLTVIDTAEMYADGGAEEVVGQAIRGLRDRVVLVSKVYPWHAGGTAMRRACENSLRAADRLSRYVSPALARGYPAAGDGRGDGEAGGRGQDPPLGRL